MTKFDDLLQALGVAQHGVTDPRLDLLRATGGVRRGQAAPPANPSQPTGAVGETGGALAPNLERHLAQVPGTSFYQFVQRSGPRAGQHYGIKRGESGPNVRVYRPDPVSGTRDTALAPRGTVGGQQRTPEALGQAMDPSFVQQATAADLLRRLLAGRALR